MTPLNSHLSRLGAQPDPTALDAALVEALADLLAPCSVVLYGVTGEPDDRRWFERARTAGPGAAAAVTPSPWLDPSVLPALASAPQRLACLTSGDSVSGLPDDDASPATHKAWWPLLGDEQAVGVVELSAPLALPFAATRWFDQLQRVYRQTHSVLDAGLRDSLTGLLNRQAFDASFDSAVRGLPAPVPAPDPAPAVERRQGGEAGHGWLAVANLDQFRRFNEAQGHLAGDDVLVALGHRLLKTLRCQDRLFRFGGGAFVLMLRCPGETALRAVLDRCLACVADHGATLVPPLSTGIGFTALRPGDAPGAALARAESALRRAKDRGCGQVCADTD